MHYNQMIALDPRFAEAWAYLSIAHHDLYWAFDRPAELPLVIEAVKKAQELASDIPETHLALGFVAYTQREFTQALDHFDKADRLRPSGETAQAIGFTLRRLGRWQEALNYGEKARRLLPRSAFIYLDILGTTNWYLRDFDEAERTVDHAIWLYPQAVEAYFTKALVLMEKGDLAAAKKTIVDMSNRIELSEMAEYMLPQGLTVWNGGTYLRLFPEMFRNALDAFEAGPIERYRSMQPAMIASDHLAQALIDEATGDRRSASLRYESARDHFELIIRSNPQSAYVTVYSSDLGLVYAGLGRCEEAIRMGEEAVRMMPISKDALVGPALVGNLAEIYFKCGQYEKAIDQLEIWLSVPSGLSVALLRLDPIWDPIRSHPRFLRLVEGK